jgi:hypothetical protein
LKYTNKNHQPDDDNTGENGHWKGLEKRAQPEDHHKEEAAGELD